MKKYLIIGNGVAGTTAAEHIRKNDPEGSITIISDEGLPFYYRVRLNEFISGEITEEGLIAKNELWHKDHDIDLMLNSRVVKADSGSKTITTSSNKTLEYDSLLIATGSHSFFPPIKGSAIGGVFSLRNVLDARNITATAKHIDDVVIIGGGLLGLEAGNAIRKSGKRVIIVEFFPRLLPRQLDTKGAEQLQQIMEGFGFSFRLGTKTEEILGQDRVEGVLLEGGETLPAGMVIISAGVRPNLELAEELGLENDKGIQVNERLRTSNPDIFAAGDVAEFRGMPYGIWPAAMEQGRIAGINMAGGDAVYKGTTMANTLKVVGIDLASAGEIDAENKLESTVITDENTYKKFVIENNRIVGCIMLGDIKNFNKVKQAIIEKQDASLVVTVN